MRKTVLFVGAMAAMFLSTAPARYAAAQETGSTTEYIDIRWDGTDRMCVVFANGRVDFIGKELEKVPRPDDANKRAFYMTLALNKMAAQGYEFVSMISDEIIMKRRVPR